MVESLPKILGIAVAFDAEYRLRVDPNACYFLPCQNVTNFAPTFANAFVNVFVNVCFLFLKLLIMVIACDR